MYAVHYTQFVPDALRSRHAWLLAQPASALGLAAVGAGLERALAGVRVRFAPARCARAGVRSAGRHSCSRWRSGCRSPLRSSSTTRSSRSSRAQPLAAGERLWTALATMATMFRVTGRRTPAPPRASGWASAGSTRMPGPALQGLLTALTGASLAVLLTTGRDGGRSAASTGCRGCRHGGAPRARGLHAVDSGSDHRARGPLPDRLVPVRARGGRLRARHGSPLDRRGGPALRAIRAAVLLAAVSLIRACCLAFVLAALRPTWGAWPSCPRPRPRPLRMPSDLASRSARS